MKIVFYAPSYKRPEKSITQKLYPFVNVPIIYRVIYAELEIGF